MLKSAQKQSILVEVKSGETFNGTLVNCDVWMNLHLEDVIKTSSVGLSNLNSSFYQKLISTYLKYLFMTFVPTSVK